MSKFITALSILGVMLLLIVFGILLDQAWLSGLICFIGWTPAAVFLGIALAGINFSFSVKPKELGATVARPNESAKEIRERVSKVGQ